ncbi:hypothetical protein OZX68_03355 [Streptococcaceae bacterium ESL0729]|nr:hypothetical protein OZX68_03355 [Streptococcaceae bacterium ESL0729]
MDKEMMTALNVKEGDVVMAFRDPVLRDGAVRAYTVKFDDSVHGIAVNPLADKSHDMDFDGDTMGIKKLNSKAAIEELKAKFSHVNNMVDKGAGKDENGLYPLYFQSGMDISSAIAFQKENNDGVSEIEELLETIKIQANSSSEKIRSAGLRKFNEFSKKVFREVGFGTEHIDLTSNQTVMNSYTSIVRNKAKGNPAKLKEVADYNGYKLDVEGGDDKEVIQSIADMLKEGREIVIKEVCEHSLMGEKEARDIQFASGIKSDDTGLAGSTSQRAVATFRNRGLTEVLEITYPITQGTLQIKHDAAKANTVNVALSIKLKNLYDGKSADGVQSDLLVEDWKGEMAKLFTDELDVDYNEEYLDTLANMLSDGYGRVMSLAKATELYGSPFDRIAYGQNGYEMLNEFALQNRNILEGVHIGEIAPTKIREAYDNSKFAIAERIVNEPTPVVKDPYDDIDYDYFDRNTKGGSDEPKPREEPKFKDADLKPNMKKVDDHDIEIDF